MNYGHTCKYCGETFLSNDKAKVATLRKEHKRQCHLLLKKSWGGILLRPSLFKSLGY